MFLVNSGQQSRINRDLLYYPCKNGAVHVRNIQTNQLAVSRRYISTPTQVLLSNSHRLVLCAMGTGVQIYSFKLKKQLCTFERRSGSYMISSFDLSESLLACIHTETLDSTYYSMVVPEPEEKLSDVIQNQPAKR